MKIKLINIFIFCLVSFLFVSCGSNNKATNNIKVKKPIYPSAQDIKICNKSPNNVECLQKLVKVTLDIVKNKEILEKQANKGDAISQYKLGELYYRGLGNTKPNYIKAKKLFEESAKQGLADAQYFLGLMYNNGKGVQKNVIKAKELYEKAANQGFLIAFYNLGFMYYHGNEIEQDLNKAKYYMKQSCELGLSISCEFKF